MKSQQMKFFVPFFLFLAISFSFAQDVEYNKVDGFTSASKYFSVDSIFIYRTYAVIYWWEYYESDSDIRSYRIDWGTDTASFTNTLDLKPYIFNSTMVDTIQSLADSTEYYGRFFRDYKGRAYITNFRFNTPPLPNSVRQSRPPRLRSVSGIASIDLFTIDGKRISHLPVDQHTDLNAIGNAVKSPGLYIVQFRGNAGQLIKAEKILIGG